MFDVQQVVGRGGQTIMAVISWHVFTRYVMLCMETTPITFEAFKMVFLQKETSFYSVYKLLKNFISRRLLSKTAMVRQQRSRNVISK